MKESSNCTESIHEWQESQWQ